MPPTWSTPGIQQLRANSGGKLGSLYASWLAATTSSGLVAYRIYAREAIAPDAFGLASAYFVAEVAGLEYDIYQASPLVRLKTGTTYSVIVRAVDDSHSEHSTTVSLSKMVPGLPPSPAGTDTNDVFPFIPHYPFTEDVGFRVRVTDFESGKEQRAAVWSTPLRRFTVKLDPLHKTESPSLTTLWQFYIDHGGPLKTFLFDADINSAEVHEAISETGAGTSFSGTLGSPKIKRSTFRGFVGATQSILDDGVGGLTGSVLTSGSINYESGVYAMTFGTAPGTTVSCFYQQQYRVRFEEQILSRELMGWKLYSVGLNLLQVK
jgi:hypothetical protein